MARDVLRRTLKIVHRCGFEDSESAVREEVTELHERGGRDTREAEGPESLKAPHVLTVWNEDGRYVDARGEPLPLARYGRAPSFESLVRSVDRKLKAAEILRYLIRTGAVNVQAGKYCCVRRLVILRGIPGTADFRALRCLDAMLRNAEHNSRPANVAPPWLERMAENDNFPVRALSQFAEFLEQETMGYLGRLDAYMRSVEVARKEGEPTIRLGVGMYRFEEPGKDTGESNGQRRKARGAGK